MDLLSLSVRYEWQYRLLGIVLIFLMLSFILVMDSWWICLPLFSSFMLVILAYIFSLKRREYKKKKHW